MKRRLTITAISLLLAGCATNQPEVTTAPYSPHTRGYWTSVFGMADSVGERQSVLCRSDEYGRIGDMQRDCFPGHNSGLWSGIMAGAAAGSMQMLGFAGGMALLRPSPTNVTNSNSNAGGYVAPGAASAVASPVATASPTAQATGGNGGNATANPVATGGAGGNAAGGNATASPNITASPTISPNITATGGVGSATGGNATAQGGTASPTVVNTATASPRISTRATASQTQTSIPCNTRFSLAGCPTFPPP